MPPVYIVSERLAQRLWPGQDPIGKRLAGPGTALDAQGRPVWATLVGVVEDAHYRGLTDVRFDLYSPYSQPRTMAVKHLMVRGSADLQSLVSAIRAEARRLEPTSLVEGATTMEAMVRSAVAPWRFGAVTLMFLVAFALLVATLGICGTISQLVIERRREIAVPMAVGGVGGDIIRLVFREGMEVTIVGLIVGLTRAVAVGAVAALLFGVAPVDGATMAATAMLFVIVSALALLLPAWRATAVDPATVLKHE
jgi:predicted lysophospholipase L1 biosynthesis ABC-type transport system permease subunit